MGISNIEKRKLKTEPKLKLELNEEQKKVIENFYNYDVIFVEGLWGCLAKGTKVIMYNGTMKEVEDIIVGDELMGPDSKPRKVLSLCRGREQMYWVRQNRGMDYRVNENHILSLKEVIPSAYSRKTINGKRIIDKEKLIREKKVNTINISVLDYIESPLNFKIRTQGYIVDRIDWKDKDSDLKIDPYYLGLWLGDGTSINTNITTSDNIIIEWLQEYCVNNSLKLNKLKDKYSYSLTSINGKNNWLLDEIKNLNLYHNKHIPLSYKTSSYEDRMRLLAGLIDSDGYYDVKGKGYEIIQKNKELATDIYFLCNSLGFKAVIKDKVSTMRREDDSIYKSIVYRITFSPYKEIPVLLDRKRYKNDRIITKNPLHTEITIEKDIVDDYYGFTIDGDNLFLLEDFTVTHNSGKTFAAVAAAIKSFRKKEVDKIVITRPFIVDKGLGALPGEIENKLIFEMQPIIDNFYSLQGKEETDKMMKEGSLVFQYNGKIKGMTLSSCVFLVDELQDATYSQFMELLTRLGKDSKMISTLSKEQIHHSIGNNSCFYKLEKLKYSGIVGWNELTSNHRHDIINKIIDYIKDSK